MLVPWGSLNGRHKDTAMCRSGADKKRRRNTEAEIRESAERAFEAYGGQLESVSSFTYLGRVMTAGDDDCTWGMYVLLLSGTPFYKSWVIPPRRCIRPCPFALPCPPMLGHAV